MMLVSSRVALEYNKRKKRSGAFWEDNYHATAVGAESHLHRCLIYIDLNMVRAKVVDHPKDWPHCGYHEITGKKFRYLLIDKIKLMELLGINSTDELRIIYESWVEENLSLKKLRRESMWTENIAIGNRDFVEKFEKKLDMKVKDRKIEEAEDNQGDFFLKECRGKYLEAILRAGSSQ